MGIIQSPRTPTGASTARRAGPQLNDKSLGDMRTPSAAELQIAFPTVAVSLDGARAILINRIEAGQYQQDHHDAFYFELVVQLTPRAEPCFAKLLCTGPLQHAWDIPQQTIRWPTSFIESLPALAPLAVGEYLDSISLPAQPEGSRYAFTATLDTGLFDILQRPPATDGSLLAFLKSKVAWAWRYKLPVAHAELGDATRLGVTVPDLTHAAYPYEGRLWTRVGETGYRPTPEFLRGNAGINTDQSAATAGLDAVYDVALSFAGEQRVYVEDVATALVNAGIRVFYDNFEDLWGSDLTKTLEDVYRRRSRFVVVFVSKEYIAKAWPNLERQHALVGRLERMDNSVLPARFESIELPGLPGSVGYLDIAAMPAADLAKRIVGKIRK